MFKLRLNPFRFVPFSGLLFLLVVGSTEVDAQIDSIIFARNDIYRPESVVYLGDQNNDGYDDFVLCTFFSINGYTGRALLFCGGNPINPVPAMSFDIYSSAGYGITACDYNRDGYRDLIITTHIIKPLKFKVYLGGPNMNTIPDFIFNVTDNSIGDLQLFGSDWPIDFNGDGFEELLTHSYQMYGQKGAFIIYNSAVEIDSIPDKIVSYVPEEQISPADITFGDLDGDGRTDLTFLLNSSSIPVNFNLRRFVFGRADFSFEDTVNFLDSFQLVGNNNIIQDINKDGKSDLLTHDGQNKYPYWYRIGISYGSRDVNITPEEGFNTQNEGWTYSRSIGDVNGDGYGDFLTSLS